MQTFDLQTHLGHAGAAPSFLERVCVLKHDRDRSVLGWAPENDSALVLPLAEADRTKGGLIMPEQHRDKPQKGIVLAVGGGLYDPEQRRVVPLSVQVGDLVTYGKYSGEVFEIAGDFDGAAIEMQVYIMRAVEIKARKAAGTFALIDHLVGADSTHPRRLYHESHLLCEHCVNETSAVVLEERQRLLDEQKDTTDSDVADAGETLRRERERLLAERAEEEEVKVGNS